MLKVISFGEALIDLLSNKLDQGASEIEKFTKFPGGAPANAAVAIAKLGGNSYFAGMLGKDSFGQFIHQSLVEQNVNTDHVLFTSDEKTGLAFVSLDDNGERNFEFYRPPAADLCFRSSDFEDSWFFEQGIFHYCSNSLTESSICHATDSGLELAKKNDWLISFDVNLRVALWPKNIQIAAIIEPFIHKADIVKMSKEELDYLSEKQNQSLYIKSLLNQGVSLILITDAGNPIKWYTQSNQGSISPPNVRPIDTTAAGDAFIGGFLFHLSKHLITRSKLLDWLKEVNNIENSLSFASACGAHAVSIYGAFPSLPSQSTLQPFLSAS